MIVSSLVHGQLGQIEYYGALECYLSHLENSIEAESDDDSYDNPCYGQDNIPHHPYRCLVFLVL